MKIAIIVDDPVIKSKLQKKTTAMNLVVDFFHDSKDFGSTKLREYGIIFADLFLKPLDGRQILQSIGDKTDADLYLMGNGTYSESDVNNEHIMGLINRENAEDVIDKISFVEVKKRLQESVSAMVVF